MLATYDPSTGDITGRYQDEAEQQLLAVGEAFVHTDYDIDPLSDYVDASGAIMARSPPQTTLDGMSLQIPAGAVASVNGGDPAPGAVTLPGPGDYVIVVSGPGILSTPISVTIPSDEEVVPSAVGRLQARLALLDAGLLADVESAIAQADARTQMAWADATSFDRDSPTIASMALALGMSSTEVDALFIAAGKIKP